MIITILHNPNGPAIIRYNTEGFEIDIKYYIHGKLHRLDGPASISNFADGMPWQLQYHQNGKLHNPNGPSIITYSLSNIITYKAFYLNNKLTSIDSKPAEIYYDKSGKAKKVIYSKKNKLHRLTGPAITVFNKHEIKQDYFINGNKLTELQYLINKQNFAEEVNN